ncbi:MAG TPA: glycosyltransferase, partial [Acidobacteriota bacterium]|nr:glycosyltransferase [Acidobacteriota bacterium]
MPAYVPQLSIVIPAYQEEKRIGPTLDQLGNYLATRSDRGIEVIVVSGGSTDGTVDVARQFENRIAARLRVLDLPTAKGKGAAVRAGMREASGKFVIFTDADLAYDPRLFDDFVARLESGADIVIAQRTGATEYAGLMRRWVAAASRFIFERFITPGIGDTQAGLKAFTRAVAQDLFSQQTISGVIFDVEILVLARRRKYRVEKAFVDWQDKPGS